MIFKSKKRCFWCGCDEFVGDRCYLCGKVLNDFYGEDCIEDNELDLTLTN